MSDGDRPVVGLESQSTEFFAHAAQGRPESDWHGLPAHLRGVAELAEGFAYSFNAGDWAKLVGWWHDLGKFSDAFQNYLRAAAAPDSHVSDSAAKTDHSTAGAQHAADAAEILGHLLAYVISGHHSGLLDGRGDGPCLERRLSKHVEPWEHGLHHLPQFGVPELPPFVREAIGRRDAYSLSFFVRMLFSCLTDADFLDTERFMDPGRAAMRPTWPPDVLARMERALNEHFETLRTDDSAVNRQRGAVREACIAAAALDPGLFSLTVPTGGGKTLSSLAFALRHAIRHKLRRIVYIIPFTTIIEQNADVFRRVMAPLTSTLDLDPVLEHHSNLDVGKETVISRLATENWDAPLVVTTSVQFYESLYANRTSHCRKLHNLAESVVILDEVQTLPIDYLEPCLRVLRELADNYKASVVLCTATQPAIHHRDGFPIGLTGVREIIPEPQKLYLNLKRADVVDIGLQPDTEIAARLRKERRALCIVNTRAHAAKLFAGLGDGAGQFHLSALMCPEHRTRVFRDICRRLDNGDECRVISTQLIEAGVDIDFPVVFRSLAGIDSIAQAAGRCNRNGRLFSDGRLGQTYVFRSEHTRSELFFTETANTGAQVLDLYDDPLALEAIEHYFRLYYWDQQDRWDKQKILLDFKMHQDRSLPFSFAFEGVARKFHLIESLGNPLIIPWGDRGMTLCRELRDCGGDPPWWLLRALQRYTVEVPRKSWERHTELGDIELVHDRFPVLFSPEVHYSEATGLRLDAMPPSLLSD